MMNETILDVSVREVVRDIMLDRSLQAFDKRRRVTAMLKEALRDLGDFCRTRDGRLFFFAKPERQLYDLEQRPFQHLLTVLSGLSATENGFRFVLDTLQAETARAAPVVEVQTLSFYDPATGLLAVSDGGGGVWLHERRGEWTFTHNGDHGLVFFTELGAQAWEPEFGDGEALRAYLGAFLFDDGALSAEDQRTLLLVYLLHQLFPALRLTRVIPAFLGPQGSGKTSGCRRLGRLLAGSEFDVSGLQRDREDAFVSLVTNTVVAALDNVDARVPWIEDALATYATGRRYDLRRLYTTNERVSYEPRSILLVNSRDPHFRRPDVAERLLPLYCVRPSRYVAEPQLKAELRALRPQIWGALLTRAAALADRLPSLTPPMMSFRMADFATFGWCLFEPLGQAEAWLLLLNRLERAQMAFAAEGDGVVEALRTLLTLKGSIGPTTTGDLFKECQRIAEEENLPFPRTASGFGQRLTNLRRVIELELRVRFIEESAGGGRRIVSLVSRASADQDQERDEPS